MNRAKTSQVLYHCAFNTVNIQQTDNIYISFQAARDTSTEAEQWFPSLRLGNRLQRLNHDNTISPDNLGMNIGYQH
jgi:hypothetical protein